MNNLSTISYNLQTLYGTVSTLSNQLAEVTRAVQFLQMDKEGDKEGYKEGYKEGDKKEISDLNVYLAKFEERLKSLDTTMQGLTSEVRTVVSRVENVDLKVKDVEKNFDTKIKQLQELQVASNKQLPDVQLVETKPIEAKVSEALKLSVDQIDIPEEVPDDIHQEEKNDDILISMTTSNPAASKGRGGRKKKA